MKVCPYCAEQIQDAAILCRFCGSKLAVVEPLAEPPSEVRWPDVVVEIPSNPDGGLIRSRVQKALLAAGHEKDAQEYLRETEDHRDDLRSLMTATSRWVTVSGGSGNASPVRSEQTTETKPEEAPGGLWQPVNPVLATLLVAAVLVLAIVIGVAATSGDEESNEEARSTRMRRSAQDAWDSMSFAERDALCFDLAVLDPLAAVELILTGNERYGDGELDREEAELAYRYYGELCG